MRGLELEVLTGALDGDGSFAGHGHTVRLDGCRTGPGRGTPVGVTRRPAPRHLPRHTPLRLDRDYRWLWTGQAVNGIGTQITRLALPFQVYVLTGSTLAIAALTLFQLVPILIFSLGAGSVADAVDRRRLLPSPRWG